MFTDKELEGFMRSFFPNMHFDMDMENCNCGDSCECTPEHNCGCMDKKSKPLVYGFDLQFRNGKPILKEWGNMESPLSGKIPRRTENIIDERAKAEFIDNPKEHKGKIIAEMPGVEKKDFQLAYRQGILYIDVQGDTKEYHESVSVPVKIDEDTIKAIYKNGILNISFDYDKGIKSTPINVE
jgi:HSP20 family protein